MKVLISDKLSNSGLNIFKQAAGIEVDYQPGLGKDIEKLKKVIAGVDAISIRSGTNLTEDILKCASKLKVIGRAGIGVDNINVAQATKQGIIVMNTPGGNTITTAEHAISMMSSLARNIPQATASLKSGKWEKSKFTGSELYQKTLGVVGCGNIGRIVANRALGLKMRVIAFDPFLTDELAEKIGVIKVDLNELYKQADFITIHVPKNDKTKNLINKDAFAKMKKGVYLINCARGGIVHEADLVIALESGIVTGAALDVFEVEPVDPSNPLLKMDQVICTPHLGAATSEAQENVAIDIAHQIVDYLTTGTIQNALNVPSVSGEVMGLLTPYIELAEKIGKIQGQLADKAPNEICIEYCGKIAENPTGPLTIATIKGVLEPILNDESINVVNAPSLAKERGIKILETKTSEHKDFTNLMTVTLKFKDSQTVISGTIFGKAHPRLIRINDYDLDVLPEGHILMIHNHNQPGVVGAIGTLLGKNKINISRVQLALNSKSKEATAFYNIDSKIDPAVLEELKKLPGIISTKEIIL